MSLNHKPSAAGHRAFGRWRDVLLNLAAIAIAAVLFAASFPNPFIEKGVFFLAYFAYIPALWVVSRVRVGASVFYGALFGYASYGLFNYWLSVFHPLAGLIVGLIFLCYFAVFFPLLKLASVLFPRRGYILQWLLWVAFEYLRTQGFLGYSFGVSGYSQWTVQAIIGIADIFGVWGVSALVLFPSAYLAAALCVPFPAFFRREWLAGVLWCAALAATLIYGGTARVDYRDAPTATIAAIQHNTDPWMGGPTAYRRNLEVLTRLSDEALAACSDLDLVVWSESAFVPMIYWHINYRESIERVYYEQVRDLMNYLADKDVPFVIGNDDGRREVLPSGSYDRVDYNAALLFNRDEIAGAYRKIHLVPFTENFPYEKQLPWIYQALKNADTHFWKPGKEATVFEINGLKFSTPICFEDTFGDLSREFTRNGAEIIINLTNDAWSQSLSAQNQHLSMAVFRAVENRRSLLRSTASGQTCAVDPNGAVLALAEPFTESYLIAALPIVTTDTVYTKYGDVWGMAAGIAAALFFLAGIAFRVYKAAAASSPALVQ
jgi:apolipoprotein N-acyltransferase